MCSHCLCRANTYVIYVRDSNNCEVSCSCKSNGRPTVTTTTSAEVETTEPYALLCMHCTHLLTFATAAFLAPMSERLVVSFFFPPSSSHRFVVPLQSRGGCHDMGGGLQRMPSMLMRASGHLFCICARHYDSPEGHHHTRFVDRAHMLPTLTLLSLATECPSERTCLCKVGAVEVFTFDAFGCRSCSCVCRLRYATTHASPYSLLQVAQSAFITEGEEQSAAAEDSSSSSSATTAIAATLVAVAAVAAVVAVAVRLLALLCVPCGAHVL